MGGSSNTVKLALKGAITEAFGVLEGRVLWDLPARLVESMPRRIQAVINASGYQTKY